MEIKYKDSYDIKFIYISGEIKMDNSVEIKNSIVDLMESGEKKIVLNFENVPAVDSSGIGILVSLIKKSKSKDVKIKFSTMNKRILNIIKLINLLNFFEIYDSDNDAIKSFI